MQTVTFDSVLVDELDGNFTKALKALFLGHKVKITVEPEMTETEYLNSSAENKRILEQRMANIEQNLNLRTFNSVAELRQAIK